MVVNNLIEVREPLNHLKNNYWSHIKFPMLVTMGNTEENKDDLCPPGACYVYNFYNS